MARGGESQMYDEAPFLITNTLIPYGFLAFNIRTIPPESVPTILAISTYLEAEI